jgi:hypothetical protein
MLVPIDGDEQGARGLLRVGMVDQQRSILLVVGNEGRLNGRH